MKRIGRSGLIEVVFYAAIIGVLVLLLSLCMRNPNDNEARGALDDHGFSDITITDHGTGFAGLHGCSDSDGAWYDATANNPAGKRVTVTVCCGGGLQYKGCTIRSNR